jgi:hypothetical protein
VFGQSYVKQVLSHGALAKTCKVDHIVYVLFEDVVYTRIIFASYSLRYNLKLSETSTRQVF